MLTCVGLTLSLGCCDLWVCLVSLGGYILLLFDLCWIACLRYFGLELLLGFSCLVFDVLLFIWFVLLFFGACWDLCLL